MAQFIKRQESLEELNLHKNNLSSAQITELLEAIHRSPTCLRSIKKLQLNESSFDQHEACEVMAQIVAEAPRLEQVNILN